MWITRVSINNPVFATMVMVALTVLGIFSYARLKVEQMPDVSLPFVYVQTDWPGASPEAVESDITKPIEYALNTVSGVKLIRSNSLEGRSQLAGLGHAPHEFRLALAHEHPHPIKGSPGVADLVVAAHATVDRSVAVAEHSGDVGKPLGASGGRHDDGDDAERQEHEGEEPRADRHRLIAAEVPRQIDDALFGREGLRGAEVGRAHGDGPHHLLPRLKMLIRVLAAVAFTPGDERSPLREDMLPIVADRPGLIAQTVVRVAGDGEVLVERHLKRFPKDGSATTADFRRVMEEHSELAGLDLSGFFQQWLARAGSPVVEGGWRYDAATKKIVVELSQTQPGEAYRLPLELGIAVEGSQLRIEKIELTQKQQRFEITADKEPTNVLLDPNVWALMEFRFAKR